MKMVKTTFSATLLSFLLISCGDDAARSRVQVSDTNLQRTSSNLKFQFLNTSVATNILANGSLRLNGGKLHIEMESDGHSPNSRHIQIIYSKTRCPLDTDDANGDGIVDYTEAVGDDTNVLTLTNDFTAEGQYPTADEAGKYQYNVSLDSNLEKSNLEGRAVIIHGISETVTLPDTVQGGGDLSAHESLPIACAVIEFEEDQDQTTTGSTGDMTTTGDHQQTTSGKGGYQEQTTGGKGGYQEQTTGHQQQQQQQQTEWHGDNGLSGETTGL